VEEKAFEIDHFCTFDLDFVSRHIAYRRVLQIHPLPTHQISFISEKLFCGQMDGHENRLY